MTKRFFRKLKRLSLAQQIIGVVALLIVALLVLELTNTTHIFHKQKLDVSTIPTLKAATDNSASTAAPSESAATTNPKDINNSGTSSSNSASSSVSASNPLTPPSGTFVSDHYPGSNGHPYTEESTCHTDPGVNCYIEFTQGSTVKNLATQTTNGSGSTSWSWDVQQAGLTSGSWQVTAIASSNGQTKTTSDPIHLEVP